jgi:hypothetical protein
MSLYSVVVVAIIMAQGALILALVLALIELKKRTERMKIEAQLYKLALGGKGETEVDWHLPRYY